MEPNEVNFLDLLVAIETSNKHLSLLLAVCDRDRLRNSLTDRYEQELAAEGIKAYRVDIDRQEPSLFAAINQLVETETYLQAGNPAVITVEGVVSLSSFVSEGERSPVDKFLGYLQWTREGMRQFEFPIVIWVTEHIHNEISRKAQDFYSWRQGVFFFELIQEEPIAPIDFNLIDLPEFGSDDSDLPIDELLVYIAQREASGQVDTSLATFYTLLARAYKRDNQIDRAIFTWQKALNLQEKLNLSLELANSLNELGVLYYYQGKYNEAEPLYLRSLEIREQQLGADHPDVATSLNNLALLDKSQGKYSEAEPLYLRSLEIRERQLGSDHPVVVTSLNNLVSLYQAEGKYSEAKALYLRSLNREQEAEIFLLGEVKTEVRSRLRHSLHREVSITLDKEIQLDRVRTWNASVKIGMQIIDGTSILNVFQREDVAGRLLILGKPGSGKTTTYLELANELLDIAESDLKQPIPILFNLSSWKNNEQSIADWVVAETKSKYGVSVEIAQNLLKQKRLLPMLDGLDELESHRQEPCVLAINQWMVSEHRPRFLVVCSRSEEYDSYSAIFQLNAAIYLQPLSDQQLAEYFQVIDQPDLWQKLRRCTNEG